MEKKRLQEILSKAARMAFSLGLIAVVVALALALSPSTAVADHCQDGSHSGPGKPPCADEAPGGSGDAPGQGGDGDGDGGPGQGGGGGKEKVGVCHAAGQRDTSKFVFLTVPANTGGFPQGHFTEGGSTAAGHENDTLSNSRADCQGQNKGGDGDGDGTPGTPSGDGSSGTVIIPVTGISLIEDSQAANAFRQDAAFGILGLGLIASGILLKRKSITL